MQHDTLIEVPTEQVKFLIVDDDQVSVMAVKRAIKKLKILNSVVVAKDGQQALDILRADCAPNDRLPPYLVTLDINMPRMDGHEFLAEIRKDSTLHRAIIFVLSTSDAPKDISTAYDQNVAGYIIKDDLGDSFTKALDMLGAYSKVVELPR